MLLVEYFYWFSPYFVHRCAKAHYSSSLYIQAQLSILNFKSKPLPVRRVQKKEVLCANVQRKRRIRRERTLQLGHPSSSRTPHHPPRAEKGRAKQQSSSGGGDEDPAAEALDPCGGRSYSSSTSPADLPRPPLLILLELHCCSSPPSESCEIAVEQTP